MEEDIVWSRVKIRGVKTQLGLRPNKYILNKKKIKIEK
jgi:hypothetical protein